MAARYRGRVPCGKRVRDEAAMWQQGKGGGFFVAVGYRRRLLCGSTPQEEAHVARGYSRRLLCGSKVQEEGTRGGCYVAAGYKRRLLCGSKVKGAATMWQ